MTPPASVLHCSCGECVMVIPTKLYLASRASLWDQCSDPLQFQRRGVDVFRVPSLGEEASVGEIVIFKHI